MSADLKQRIREHLETAMSPDNLTSTREKYEKALALLREVGHHFRDGTQMVWQPIETAPKNKPILLLEADEDGDADDERRIFVGIWDKSRDPAIYDTKWACVEYDAYSKNPTHWAPLPPILDAGK